MIITITTVGQKMLTNKKPSIHQWPGSREDTGMQWDLNYAAALF